VFPRFGAHTRISSRADRSRLPLGARVHLALATPRGHGDLVSCPDVSANRSWGPPVVAGSNPARPAPALAPLGYGIPMVKSFRTV
jgi:hypothetical protein